MGENENEQEDRTGHLQMFGCSEIPLVLYQVPFYVQRPPLYRPKKLPQLGQECVT